MTPEDWDPRICNERAGFLFQHDCSNLPESHCAQCGKPVCGQHTHYLDNEPYCTACAKQDYKQRQKQTGRKQKPHDDDTEYGDPYFYGDSYYDGYGRYRAGYWGYQYYRSRTESGVDGDLDFTSADAESMQWEGDGDFETDMSES